MYLVELLARELDVWPEQAECATQESGGCAYFWKSDRLSYVRGDWVHGSGCGLIDEGWSHSLSELAADHKTAIITRADWQAERERIAGGWIAWGGGECPLDKGVSLDYMMRDGVESTDSAWVTADMLRWDHRGASGDIIAYRLHKPEQQEPQHDQEEMTPAHTEYNPINTRNRILEIDRTTEALEEERGQLVQRLADEGFSLLQVVTQSEPAEDMSDWRNWREGDMLEFLQDDFGETENRKGAVLPIVELEGDGYDGELPAQVKGGWPYIHVVRWHSRPTA